MVPPGRKGVQYFLRGAERETVYPKDMWHGGTNYPRISRTGVPKRGDVGITVTPGSRILIGENRP